MSRLSEIKGSILSVLKELQKEGRKLFISFIVGLISSIIILRLYAWDFFEQVMRSNMSQNLGEQVNIIAQTPFEVLLVQAKIGLFVGLVFIVPTIVYIFNKKIGGYGKKLSKIPKRAFYTSLVFGVILFFGGLWYSYYVFFPIIFEFLASATVQTNVQPMYSIARWTQFMVLLSISFGIIAQIPVSIPMFVRYEVIEYERVKYYIRFWIIGTLLIGAILSPPEPISQVMWSGPLIGLYGIALVIAKYLDPNRNTIKEDPIEDTTEDAKSDQSENILNDTITENMGESESEIGGYYYELKKIGRLLKKHILILILTFVLVGITSFYAQFSFLTEIAINTLENPIDNSEDLNVVALHPVELLMFQAKLSVLLSISITAIVAIWRIWPDLIDDSMVSISRTNMLSYIIPPILIALGGIFIGFIYVAPNFLDILVADADRINAEIAYQVSLFFWIVIYMTIAFSGIITVYFTILYLYLRGISWKRISRYWRHLVFGVILVSMFITPDSITKSLLIATPICLSILFAILTVWFIDKLNSN